MSTQLTLSFDAKATLQRDGSYRVEPGKLVAKKVEDWRKMAEVMGQMPYQDRQRNVLLLESGEINGRRYGERGHWWVEMGSLRSYMKGRETQR